MGKTAAPWLGMALPLVLLLGTACATQGDALRGERVGERRAGRDAVTVQVRNEHWSDMRVYALTEPGRHRIGTVASMSTALLDVTEPVLAPDGTVRFLLDPIGGGREHVTPSLMVWAGGRVEITVRNQISLTMASVR